MIQPLNLLQNLLRPALARLMAAGLVLGCAAMTTAMSVQPLVLDLRTSARGASGSVSVTNTFNQPIPVEVRVFPMGLSPEGAVSITGEAVRTVTIYPPTAVINPGQTQVFRLRWPANPPITDSQHYIVSVSQVPVDLGPAQNGIQLVYDFQLMASIAPERGSPNLSVSRTGLASDTRGKAVASFTLANAGVAHGYLSRTRLRLQARSPAGQSLWRRDFTGSELQSLIGFGLIPDGASRAFTLPLDRPPFPTGTSLSVEILAYGQAN